MARLKIALSVPVICLTLLFGGAAHATEPAPLEGRTLSVFVGFSNTGGGANFWRVFSTALERHLPGTSVRARFDDTLSGAQVTSELFSQPAESLSVAFVRPPDVAFAQINKREGVSYDLRRANWIAGVEQEAFIMVARKGLALDPAVLREAAEQPVLPVSDMLTTQATAGVLLNAVTGIPAKIVVGFKNSERLKALLSGDADFFTAAADQELLPLLKSGDVQSLYRIVGDEFPDEVDTTRTMDSFLVPNAPAPVVDYIKAARGMGRAFLAGPNLSPRDVMALQKAFDAALSDPAFIAEAGAMGVPVKAVPPEILAKGIMLLLPEDAAVKAEIDRAYACGLAMSEGRQRSCSF